MKTFFLSMTCALALIVGLSACKSSTPKEETATLPSPVEPAPTPIIEATPTPTPEPTPKKETKKKSKKKSSKTSGS